MLRNHHLSTISDEERYRVLITTSILIPKGSRVCNEHLENRSLTPDSIDMISAHFAENVSFSSDEIINLLEYAKNEITMKKFFDFDYPFNMKSNDCYNLTGIAKSDFEDLIKQLDGSKIKFSSNRSFRNAVGLFLTKLRLGLSHKILATIFQYSNAKAVSRTLTTVCQAMMIHFVPRHLVYRIGASLCRL